MNGADLPRINVDPASWGRPLDYERRENDLFSQGEVWVGTCVRGPRITSGGKTILFPQGGLD